MVGTLTAHERAVGAIFSNDYEFSIPRYQRPYSWGEEQARELVDDLAEFLAAHATSSLHELPPYFLGSIVLIKRDGAPAAEVVDGQQRLTTLTILLAALRASLPDRAESITKYIHQPADDIDGTADRYRLHVRERDRAFFQDNVQRAGGFEKLIADVAELPDAQHRLRANARLIAARITALSETYRTRLAGFIAQRCFLVVVATPDLDSAYRIFSVMNSRGLDLTASDIFKARLIGDVGSADEDAYTKRWEDDEEAIGRDAFTDVFAHVRMIFRKSKPKETLLKEFTEEVTKGKTARTVLDDIIFPYLKIYSWLTGASYAGGPGSDPVNRFLAWLNRVEFSDWLPPTMRFARDHAKDVAAMRTFLEAMERLTLGMLLMRTGVNARLERFSAITGEVEAGKLLPTGLTLTRDEKRLVRETIDGDFYMELNARSRSLLLQRLDALHVGDAGGASYDPAVITVEHILPQNPEDDSQWLRWFAKEGDRELWTHRLGNLTLLDRKKNSAASNFEWEQKKNAYFTRSGISPFVLTTQLLPIKTWTPEKVAERHEAMAASFRKYFGC